MPTISIQATDTLFFRDGRPFSMGEDSFAQGFFPPPPSVLHGALRSAFISEMLKGGGDQQIGVSDSADLRLKFFALQTDGGGTWFPMPTDLVLPKSKTDAIPLSLEKPSGFSNAKTPELLACRQLDKVEEGDFLLGKRTLENYLKGEQDSFEVKKRGDFLTSEPKIGIGRDVDSHIADSGRLFRIHANRPAVNSKNGVQNLRFLLSFELLELSQSGWLALGGERRAARFQAEEVVEIARPEIDSTRFKIYLATPAVFETGWHPDSLLKKYGLTLIAAALGRPQHFGGWDVEKTIPKPMLQAVPAGSVFYVSAKSIDEAKKAATEIHGNSIADNLNKTDFKAQGFGLAFVGKIHPKT